MYTSDFLIHYPDLIMALIFTCTWGVFQVFSSAIVLYCERTASVVFKS